MGHSIKKWVLCLGVNAVVCGAIPGVATALNSGAAANNAAPISLAVDATDTERGIFKISEVIESPAVGPMTLFYAKWIPGEHAPSGPIERLSGLEIRADGKILEWKRNPLNVFAFELNVPEHVHQLEVKFNYTTLLESGQYKIETTQNILSISWNEVVLYPSKPAADIGISPSVTLPENWSFATALEPVSPKGKQVAFKTVPLDVLVDSPLFAGRWFRRIELGKIAGAPVRLNVFADTPDLLSMEDGQLEAHRNLIFQAGKLFHSAHFDHYDFLLSLSDTKVGAGLEHHRSSEDNTAATYFTHWADLPISRDLLAHEFTHSWNGKYRRPQDLLSADFQAPMQNSLLWIYEGLTQYWGIVLASRSDLLSMEQGRDALAEAAALEDSRVGREWRPLLDVTNDPIITDYQQRRKSWPSWQRNQDYYSEGLLIWLDVDTKLQELSGGNRTLDDFAQLFFGPDTKGKDTAPYALSDIVATLNELQPFDWAAFFSSRVDRVNGAVPINGLSRGGYRLVYTEQPGDVIASAEKRGRGTDLTYSLGMAIKSDGTVDSVRWDGPAFKAGLKAGSKIIAVNSHPYEASVVKKAIERAKTEQDPIEMIVAAGKEFHVLMIDYHGGLRYPHLERASAGPPILDRILQARR